MARTLEQQREIYRAYKRKRELDCYQLLVKYQLVDKYNKSGAKNIYCYVKKQVKAGIISNNDWLVLNGLVPYIRG